MVVNERIEPKMEATAVLGMIQRQVLTCAS